MAAVARRCLCVVCRCLNDAEDVLYPPPSYQGGRYFMAYLESAVSNGWEAADVRLRGERQQKEARGRGEPATTQPDSTVTSATDWDVSEIDSIIDAALRRDAA